MERAMSFEVLTIPFSGKSGGFDPDILKDFVMNKKVLNYQAHFFQSEGRAYWTVFLEYDPLLKESPGPHLSEAQQQLYNKLAEWRKVRSEKDGIPHFIIATNRVLESIAYKAPKTKAALHQIRGFGNKKVEKYSDDIIHIINAFYGKEMEK
jgi:superfamily II DNA helicase RecQ